jgi:2-oxoglutarate ferredoxin oxidoreductase subunit alpha
MLKKQDEITIVIAGEAGQGVQAIEGILVAVVRCEGMHIFTTKEYMSRVRGGINSTEIRIASRRVDAFDDGIDILIALDGQSLEHLHQRVTPETLVIGNKATLADDRVVDIAFTGIAAQAGNKLYANSVAVGLISGMLNLNLQTVTDQVRQHFKAKTVEVQDGNCSAARLGYDLGRGLIAQEAASIAIARDPSIAREIVLSGAEAVVLGSLAGGCNYVCAYPMSPSTDVLMHMAEYSRDLDIIVEQVEDEVGVFNMSLGAWAAGSRAMVTTSGGGFALMTEGVSLAGMHESPAVVHLAQRPGPATGLPTRTEQGDLNLVLYAGHGDFPRIILAPGTLEEAFRLSALAFDVADRFQVPVFIMTDQYFIDSCYTTPAFDVATVKRAAYVVPTTPEYKRYALTEDGLSPRGVFGHGEGFVHLDSDEHDEDGYITESAEIRNAMVQKRQKKGRQIDAAALPPTLIGTPKDATLVICWGSTFPIVKEALGRLGRSDVALMHLGWVYPLHESVAEHCRSARSVIVVENNASGQLAQLLQLKAGLGRHSLLLKYDGMPFGVQELCDKLHSFVR